MKTYHLNWHGPFTLEEIQEQEHTAPEGMDFLEGNGLYLFTGIEKHKQHDPQLQYIGITQNSYRKRYVEHHILDNITRKRQIWLGHVRSPRTVSREDLEAIEYMLIYFSSPPLCQKKTANAPKFNCTVVSRCCWKNMPEMRKNQPATLASLPDVLSWDYDQNTLHCTTPCVCSNISMNKETPHG